jgi:hypothetical protein
VVSRAVYLIKATILHSPNPNDIRRFIIRSLVANEYPYGAQRKKGTIMSAIRKKYINQVCPHCSKKTKWAWVIRYESLDFVRLVYLCSHCEQVMKTESEKKRLSSAFSHLPRLGQILA